MQNGAYVRGMIVRSTAGRDRGDFQVILSVQPPYVTVCDGKRRPLERPKRKKAFHVAATKAVLGEERLLTNKQIRKALGAYAGASETEVEHGKAGRN